MKKLIVIIPVLAVMAAAIWFIVDMAGSSGAFSSRTGTENPSENPTRASSKEGQIFKAQKNSKTPKKSKAQLEKEKAIQEKAKYTPLHIAAEKGDLEAVKKEIQEGADINTPNSSGMTPLALAMLRKNNEIAELLISEGADIQARDKVDNSMLHVATFSGMSKIVSSLIEKGIDVNAKNKAGETPLFEAVRQGNLALAELLLENGAKPNTSNILGKTALHLAAEKGNKAIVTLLLEKGADPKAVYSTQEGDEVSVIDSARKEEIKEIIEDYISK